MIFGVRTTVGKFIELSLFYDMKSAIEEISKMDIPKAILVYKVPSSLDHITFGQRIDLEEINTDEDFFFKPLEIIANFTKDQIKFMRAVDVIRFGQFVISELKRFNDRDVQTLKYKYDKEEIEAGIKEINHGIFGTIDMIAKRMNITHDAVLELSQSKVYMMLKIDIDNANYQKNLRDIFKNKQ